MPMPMEYDPDAGAYRVALDAVTYEAVGTVVVEAVARVAGADPADLPPLYPVLDPDALDELLRSGADGPAAESLAAEFSFEGYRVTARPEELLVRPEAAEGGGAGGRTD